MAPLGDWAYFVSGCKWGHLPRWGIAQMLALTIANDTAQWRPWARSEGWVVGHDSIDWQATHNPAGDADPCMSAGKRPVDGSVLGFRCFGHNHSALIPAASLTIPFFWL